jgi:hypothetical protein
MLDVTEGLSDADLKKLEAAEWAQGDFAAEDLKRSIRAALTQSPGQTPKGKGTSVPLQKPKATSPTPTQKAEGIPLQKPKGGVTLQKPKGGVTLQKPKGGPGVQKPKAKPPVQKPRGGASEPDPGSKGPTESQEERVLRLVKRARDFKHWDHVAALSSQMVLLHDRKPGVRVTGEMYWIVLENGHEVRLTADVTLTFTPGEGNQGKVVIHSQSEMVTADGRYSTEQPLVTTYEVDSAGE